MWSAEKRKKKIVFEIKSVEVVYGHTTMNTPVLVRSQQLSIVGPG